MSRRSVLSLPMAIFATLGLSAKSKSVSAEQAFWTWFENHQDALWAVKDGQERVFGELADQIKKVNPYLVFEFGPVENGRREFTVSADGIKDAFPAVEALYAAAPPLPRWKILKFRQRRDPSDLKYKGVTVKAESVTVEATRNGEKMDIILFFPGYSDSTREVYLGLAFLLLDQTLGEYDVEMRVGKLEVRAAPGPSGRTHPLKELPKVLDSAFAH